MKKIIAMAASIILVASLFAGCGSNSEPEVTTPETTVSTPETTPETTPEETTETEGGLVGEITDEPVELTGLALSGQNILNAGEWPMMMMQQTDPEYIKEFFLIDTALYKEVYAAQCMVTATIGELIIIEVEEGGAEDAIAVLEKRKQKLIDQDVFYPATAVIAQDSVVGRTGNYVYFIANGNGTDAVVEAIEAELG